MKDRYLVILDKEGMIENILYSKEEILKYLNNESNTEASKREDDDTFGEI